MNRDKITLITLFTCAMTLTSLADQTIVFLRHAEKPKAGLGQITSKGLERALALPDVLVSKYGKPDHIFATMVEPKVENTKECPATEVGKQYHYMRPLVTIEPTAIKLEMPVNSSHRFENFSSLQGELMRSEYKDSTSFVCWEHHMLTKLVKNYYLTLGGDPADVPNWPDEDYDSIYVLRIANDGEVSFSHDYQGL